MDEVKKNIQDAIIREQSLFSEYEQAQSDVDRKIEAYYNMRWELNDGDVVLNFKDAGLEYIFKGFVNFDRNLDSRPAIFASKIRPFGIDKRIIKIGGRNWLTKHEADNSDYAHNVRTGGDYEHGY